jgi:hypothetical protein
VGQAADVKSRPRVRFSKFIEPSVRHQIFKAIQEASKVNEDGSITWPGFRGVDQYISTLGDAFEFPPAISAREAPAIIWRGILDALKSRKLNDSSVLEALQRITDAKLAETPCDFLMWSRLSYHHPISSSDIRSSYDGVSIRLSAHLAEYMKVSEETLSKLTPIDTKDRPGFAYLIARTKARNETEAADKIYGATELFLSLYNLALKPWNIVGSEQKPEAALMMGPYQFHYRGRKPLFPDSMWFNPSFRDEYWSSHVDIQKLSKHAPSIRKALAKLPTHPLKEPLSTALLMMNDGMEAAEMTRRTLRYWTAMERLFQPGEERTSYERIIQRATYLENPPDIARAKLARLKRIRNRYVHMGRSEQGHHQLTQYLADEVRSHLFYLIFNGDDFADHGEFIEMTDLSSNSDALQRRRRAIDRRERMIAKRRHRPD